MRDGQMTLIEYVQQVMRQKGLSAREVARRSKRGGAEGISNAYISKLLDRQGVNLTLASLRALASGLGTPETELFDAARGMRPDWANKEAAIKGRVWDVYTTLPDIQKALLESLIEGFADSTANLDPIAENDSI